MMTYVLIIVTIYFILYISSGCWVVFWLPRFRGLYFLPTLSHHPDWYPEFVNHWLLVPYFFNLVSLSLFIPYLLYIWFSPLVWVFPPHSSYFSYSPSPILLFPSKIFRPFSSFPLLPHPIPSYLSFSLFICFFSLPSIPCLVFFSHVYPHFSSSPSMLTIISSFIPTSSLFSALLYRLEVRLSSFMSFSSYLTSFASSFPHLSIFRSSSSPPSPKTWYSTSVCLPQ